MIAADRTCFKVPILSARSSATGFANSVKSFVLDAMTTILIKKTIHASTDKIKIYVQIGIKLYKFVQNSLDRSASHRR